MKIASMVVRNPLRLKAIMIMIMRVLVSGVLGCGRMASSSFSIVGFLDDLGVMLTSRRASSRSTTGSFESSVDVSVSSMADAAFFSSIMSHSLTDWMGKLMRLSDLEDIRYSMVGRAVNVVCEGLEYRLSVGSDVLDCLSCMLFLGVLQWLKTLLLGVLLWLKMLLLGVLL